MKLTQTLRPKSLITTTLTLGALAAAGVAWAQQAPKPEQLIKWRQSAYQVIAWNTGRIKASVDGTYNKDEVVKAANTIAALANSGLGPLYAPGTETGKGWHDTTVKPALFTDGKRAGELAGNFVREANELAHIAQAGDPAAVKAQHSKLNATCKACHDDFRNSN
jgi:cytochrome c556